MGLPGASTNQLSILWEFLLSGGCYTRIFGTVYSEKKKRNKRDIPGKKKCHPPPTHQNPHQHNPSVYKNMSY